MSAAVETAAFNLVVRSHRQQCDPILDLPEFGEQPRDLSISLRFAVQERDHLRHRPAGRIDVGTDHVDQRTSEREAVVTADPTGREPESASRGRGERVAVTQSGEGRGRQRTETGFWMQVGLGWHVADPSDAWRVPMTRRQACPSPRSAPDGLRLLATIGEIGPAVLVGRPSASIARRTSFRSISIRSGASPRETSTSTPVRSTSVSPKLARTPPPPAPSAHRRSRPEPPQPSPPRFPRRCRRRTPPGSWRAWPRA